MADKKSKHLVKFEALQLEQGEIVKGHCQGWIGEMLSTDMSNRQRNGVLVITDRRVVFYRKGMLTEVLETMPTSKVTSIERTSTLGCRKITIFTSGDKLVFKTLEKKAVVEEALSVLESVRGYQTPTAAPPVPPTSESPMESLKKIKELHDAGILTTDEYAAKKADLLDKI